MRHPFPFILLLLTFCSCRTTPKVNQQEEERLQLMEVDRQFSTRSAEAGLKNAYLDFIDSTATLLRPGNMPLTGGDAIDIICRNNDAGVTMTWEPKGCSLAKSGELGYTWGIYTLKELPTDSLTLGTYLNIWKKQEGGNWKLVANSANQGVE
jgi:hypothetical protein